MRMRFFVLGLLFCLATVLHSQSTSVTGTVTDNDSILWTYGTVTADFLVNPNYPNIASYTNNGVPLSPGSVHQTVSLGAGGSFGLSLYDNTQTSPFGSQWKLTICPNASAPCGILITGIAGTSQDLSTAIDAAISAPRFKPVSGTYGYADVEASIQLLPGSTYYNVTSTCPRFYSGSAWACASGGGTGISQLTGDVLAGPGSNSVASTLATVNSSPVTNIVTPKITVNGKGLVTSVSTDPNGVSYSSTLGSTALPYLCNVAPYVFCDSYFVRQSSYTESKSDLSFDGTQNLNFGLSLPSATGSANYAPGAEILNFNYYNGSATVADTIKLDLDLCTPIGSCGTQPYYNYRLKGGSTNPSFGLEIVQNPAFASNANQNIAPPPPLYQSGYYNAGIGNAQPEQCGVTFLYAGSSTTVNPQLTATWSCTGSSGTVTYQFLNTLLVATSFQGDGTNITNLSAAIQKLTGCTTAGWVYVPQSNGCAAPTAGSLNNASQYAIGYYSAAGSANTLSGIAPPASNGDYVPYWHVTASTAVAPGYTNAPALSAANMTSFPTLNQNTTGSAAKIGTIVSPSGTYYSMWMPVNDGSVQTPITSAAITSNSAGALSTGLLAPTLIELPNGVFYQSSTGTLSCYPASGGLISVSNATVPAASLYECTSGSAIPVSYGYYGVPGHTADSGAGTSPTITFNTGAYDGAGTVIVTTGTSPAGSNAGIVTITFNNGTGYTNAPTSVVLTPANANAAALSGASQVYVPAPTTTYFVITSGTTALAASTTYRWNWYIPRSNL